MSNKELVDDVMRYYNETGDMGNALCYLKQIVRVRRSESVESGCKDER